MMQAVCVSQPAQLLSATLQVLCDLGTDCADCGPWRFNATGDGSDFQADMPIKRLLSKNVSRSFSTSN